MARRRGRPRKNQRGRTSRAGGTGTPTDGAGGDGADLALLDVLRHGNVAGRFTHVAIGSGDHLFAEQAAHLAAREVVFLDTPA